jgi:hypothetical protein
MEQFLRLKDTTFDKPHLNIIRDLYVYACYTGLSYAKLFFEWVISWNVFDVREDCGACES